MVLILQLIFIVPCDTVAVVTIKFNGEQDSMKLAGSGIQLPLL
jgi:hypothetical protein